MSYAYPQSLPEVIEQQWAAADLGGLMNAPLPDRAQMLALIHAAFQASLLSEEGRPVSFRIVLCHPEELQDDVEVRGRNRAIVFAEPRPLNVPEIVRLAPAADPVQTLIGVTGDDAGALVIWGLVDAGLSWWEFVRGERGDRLSSSPPPERFTVSSSRRGSVTISRGGRVVCDLQRGEITVPAPGDAGSFVDFIGLHPRALRGHLAINDIFTQGPFGRFLQPITAAFRADVLSQLGSTWYDEQGPNDDYPQRFLLQFIERILIRVRDASHGGTILLLPEDWDHDDSRLLDRLWIKYPTDDVDAWLTLRHAVSVHRQYYDHFFPAWDRVAVEQGEFRKIHLLEDDMADAADLVRDRANLISSLCSVDGAVVLGDRLRLLGFGAEIVAHSTLREVVIAEDPTAQTSHRRPIEDFGTRHRSAFRFCATHEAVAALVVSQDGDVRAMCRVGADVVMWPSVATRTRT